MRRAVQSCPLSWIVALAARARAMLPAQALLLVGAAVLGLMALQKPNIARADEITRLQNASFALTVLDMVTTRLSIAGGRGTESNPIARPFVRSDLGALGYAILTTAVERVVFRKHPKMFIGVAGVEVYAAVHNYTGRLRALNVTRAREQAQSAAASDDLRGGGPYGHVSDR